MYNLMVSLPPTPFLPPLFFRAHWQITAEKPKESWSRRRSEGEESMSNLSVSRLPLSFSYSSIHLFIRHHWITPILFPTHRPSWFLSVLSWHVTPECMMCWFIVKLHWHTPAVAEINPSDPVEMRLQVVCLCVCVCVCVLVHGSGWLSRHDTLIMLPLLKMGSCAPFWQYMWGPGAWLCAVLMVSLRERRKTRVKEMRNKWNGRQMNSLVCMH